MTANHGDRRHGELSDSDLDALLAAASDELLTYVRKRSSPTTALLAIMAADDIREPSLASADEQADALLARELAGDRALAAIEMRALAPAFDYVLDSNCSRSLTHASYRCHDFDAARVPALDHAFRRARALAHVLTHVLTRAVDHAFDPALADALDDALAQARTLDAALDDATSALDTLSRAHNRGPDRTRAADDIALDLAETRDHVEKVIHGITRAGALAVKLDHASGETLSSIRQLRSGQIDVSGTDLSRGKFSDLKVLEGVIWTPQTVWPPGIGARLLPLSEEIGPGIYQVRGGNGRDRLGLAIV